MTRDNDTKNPSPAPTQKTVLGGADSLSSKMMRQMVESAPTNIDDVDLTALPEVDMPDLEGVVVHVPAQPPVTEDDIYERFQKVYFNVCVERQVRKAGDLVELGDEVLIDMLAYMEGRIIPFSPQQNLQFVLEEDSFLEGFAEGLVGTPVGGTKSITILRPIEDEFGLTKNLTSVFVVHVKGAASLSYPDPQAPETLAKFGEGLSLDDVYKLIGQELTSERAGAMVIEGMNHGLKAVADRIPAIIPDDLVKAQIRSEWQAQEGRFLSEKGVGREDLDGALEGWLSDPDTQASARQKLKTTLAILTAAANEEQELQPEELEGFVVEFSKSLGVDLEEWRAAVSEDPEAQVAIFDSYLYSRTALHLLSKITIQYGDA